MAGFNTDDDEMIASINVTPLVDIVLVVLIVFMVTTSYIVRAQIEVDLPKAATGDSKPATTMVLQVNPDGTYSLNGEPTTLKAIGEWAKEAKEDDPETRAVIAADKKVEYERVVNLIDTIKFNGVEKFALNIERTAKPASE